MVSTPELKRYVHKKVLLQLNGARKVAGVLRGYDLFLNLVLDDAVEVRNDGSHYNLGSQSVVRGNSIVSLEAIDTVM